MPSKKRFNSRFPPARIKKIMQTDEDIGKVAAPVPVLISRALELFLEQILTKTSEVVIARNAKTLSKSHIKHAVMNENQFDFLKDLVADIEDIPEIVEPPKSKETTPDNGTANNTTRKPRRRKDPQVNLDLDTSSDSSTNEDEGDSPTHTATHRRRDIMLPVVVDVDDEHDYEQTMTKDSDSVASLPVPIATPMASPNTMASSMMGEAMQSVAQVTSYEDDDDYDS